MIRHLAKLFRTDTGYSRILAVMSLLGGASVLSALLGLIKMKAAALVLGPVGVGLIGLLQNATGLMSILGDMGIRQSGAREIARTASGDPREYATVRHSLAWMSWLLAGGAAGIFIAVANPVATHLLGDARLAVDLRWLSIAVATTVLASAHTAVLNGHQKVRQIANVTVLAALLSCLISIAALLYWGQAAVVPIIISAPISNFILYWFFGRRILYKKDWRPATRTVVALSGSLLRLGVFVMLSAILLSCSEFAVRWLLQREFGLFSVGLFTAAWTLSTYYVNFLMLATSTEFFPRISRSIREKENINLMITNQLNATLLISFPIFIIAVAAAPLLLTTFYSNAFYEAAQLLQYIVIGDILRLMVYPMGFCLLAHSSGRTYFLAKLIEAVGFVSLSAILVSQHGLVGVGYAHFINFAFLFVFYVFALKIRMNYVPTWPCIRNLLAILISVAIIAQAATLSEGAALITGISTLLMWSVVAFRHVLLER
jgi:O-antigen/teichoic acid export membrane protein